MIQIVGFLICACLAVKLLEIGANPAYKTEGDKLVPGMGAALLFGWLAAAGFAFWLLAQGGAFPEPVQPDPTTPALTQEQIECIEKNAGNAEAVLAC